MSTDSTRGTGRTERPDPPRPPRWRFAAAAARRHRLDRPIRVPRGVETVEVTDAVEVRLDGVLDPGDMRWFDSYMPTVRIGDAMSSRMDTDDDGVSFTFYPAVDGELEGGEVEFRARTEEPFASTGLEVARPDDDRHA